MVAAYRSHAQASGLTGGAAVVTKPAGTINGDYLVAVCVTSAVSITPPASWSSPSWSLGGQIPAFVRAASSEPADYTFTPVGGTLPNTGVVIVCVKDRHPSTPIDDGDGVSGIANLVMPSVDSAGTNRLLMQVIKKASAACSWTPPGTATERFDAVVSSFSGAGGDEIVNAGGTGTRTWIPTNTAQAGVGYMMAFAPIPPGAGTFTGAYDFTGSGFTGEEGPAEGTFTGGYDFTGSGFTGSAPDVANGTFTGTYDFAGSGFTGAGGDPDNLVDVYPTEGGRRRFGGRK